MPCCDPAAFLLRTLSFLLCSCCALATYSTCCYCMPATTLPSSCVPSATPVIFAACLLRSCCAPPAYLLLHSCYNPVLHWPSAILALSSVPAIVPSSMRVSVLICDGRCSVMVQNKHTHTVYIYIYTLFPSFYACGTHDVRSGCNADRAKFIFQRTSQASMRQCNPWLVIQRQKHSG